MDKSFEDILDACLDRITLKGDSIEQCLKSHPEQATELESLLRAALSVKQIASVEPSLEFRQAAKTRLLSALAAKEEKQGKYRLPFWNWQRRWAMALAVILALLVAGGGTVAASGNSLPGDMLYPVKTSYEKVQVFFTFGNEAKANIYMKFAERRAEEIEALVNRKRDIPNSVLNVMQTETNRAIKLVNQNERLKKVLVTRLVNSTSHQKAVLARLIEAAPPKTKFRLREALKHSETAHNQAVMLRKSIEDQ